MNNLREYLRANMFDGNEDGVRTQTAKGLLDEITEHVCLYIMGNDQELGEQVAGYFGATKFAGATPSASTDVGSSPSPEGERGPTQGTNTGRLTNPPDPAAVERPSVDKRRWWCPHDLLRGEGCDECQATERTSADHPKHYDMSRQGHRDRAEATVIGRSRPGEADERISTASHLEEGEYPIPPWEPVPPLEPTETETAESALLCVCGHEKRDHSYLRGIKACIFCTCTNHQGAVDDKGDGSGGSRRQGSAPYGSSPSGESAAPASPQPSHGAGQDSSPTPLVTDDEETDHHALCPARDGEECDCHPEENCVDSECPLHPTVSTHESDVCARGEHHQCLDPEKCPCSCHDAGDSTLYDRALQMEAACRLYIEDGKLGPDGTIGKCADRLRDVLISLEVVDEAGRTLRTFSGRDYDQGYSDGRADLERAVGLLATLHHNVEQGVFGERHPCSKLCEIHEFLLDHEPTADKGGDAPSLRTMSASTSNEGSSAPSPADDAGADACEVKGCSLPVMNVIVGESGDLRLCAYHTANPRNSDDARDSRFGASLNMSDEEIAGFLERRLADLEAGEYDQGLNVQIAYDTLYDLTYIARILWSDHRQRPSHGASTPRFAVIHASSDRKTNRVIEAAERLGYNVVKDLSADSNSASSEATE